MEQFFVDLLDRLADLHQFYFQYLDGLSTEQLDWSPGDDMNSLCVLVVHVTQAERYWVGLALDNTIERNRAEEFVAKGYTVDELKTRFTNNITFYKQAFETATVATFGETVSVALNPANAWDCTRSWALLHALDHTAEHLGHAGITRQLVDRHFA